MRHSFTSQSKLALNYFPDKGQMPKLRYPSGDLARLFRNFHASTVATFFSVLSNDTLFIFYAHRAYQWLPINVLVVRPSTRSQPAPFRNGPKTFPGSSVRRLRLAPTALPDLRNAALVLCTISRHQQVPMIQLTRSAVPRSAR